MTVGRPMCRSEPSQRRFSNARLAFLTTPRITRELRLVLRSSQNPPQLPFIVRLFVDGARLTSTRALNAIAARLGL